MKRKRFRSLQNGSNGTILKQINRSRAKSIEQYPRRMKAHKRVIQTNKRGGEIVLGPLQAVVVYSLQRPITVIRTWIDKG